MQINRNHTEASKHSSASRTTRASQTYSFTSYLGDHVQLDRRIGITGVEHSGKICFLATVVAGLINETKPALKGRKGVIITNIDTNNEWVFYRQLAVSLGLRSDEFYTVAGLKSGINRHLSSKRLVMVPSCEISKHYQNKMKFELCGIVLTDRSCECFDPDALFDQANQSGAWFVTTFQSYRTVSGQYPSTRMFSYAGTNRHTPYMGTWFNLEISSLDPQVIDVCLEKNRYSHHGGVGEQFKFYIKFV